MLFANSPHRCRRESTCWPIQTRNEVLANCSRRLETEFNRRSRSSVPKEASRRTNTPQPSPPVRHPRDSARTSCASKPPLWRSVRLGDFAAQTSHPCERTKKPRGVSHALRGSYLLVRSLSLKFSETPAQLPKFKMECRSQSLGHSASLTKFPPPLSHRGGSQRGTVTLRQRSIRSRRRQRGSKTGERSFEIRDLEMFWITARLRGESHRDQIAEFMPGRFVAEQPHVPSPCRCSATVRQKRHGITAQQRLAAADWEPSKTFNTARPSCSCAILRDAALSRINKSLRRSVVDPLRWRPSTTAPSRRAKELKHSAHLAAHRERLS